MRRSQPREKMPASGRCEWCGNCTTSARPRIGSPRARPSPRARRTRQYEVRSPATWPKLVVHPENEDEAARRCVLVHSRARNEVETIIVVHVFAEPDPILRVIAECGQNRPGRSSIESPLGLGVDVQPRIGPGSWVRREGWPIILMEVQDDGDGDARSWVSTGVPEAQPGRDRISGRPGDGLFVRRTARPSSRPGNADCPSTSSFRVKSRSWTNRAPSRRRSSSTARTSSPATSRC